MDKPTPVTTVRTRMGSTVFVFRDTDGTYGNHVVEFGFATIEDVVMAQTARDARPCADEWAGIARGMKAGAL